jgi:hypothetical protein
MALIGYINLQNCWKMGKARFDFHQNELFRFPMVEISGIEPLTS